MADATIPEQRTAYGWTLRTASWAMRLIGGAAAIIGESQVKAGFIGSAGRFSSWVIKAGSFAAMIAGLALIVISFPIGKLARRHLVPIITDPSHLPRDSYVLYLRPFTEDPDASGSAPALPTSPYSLSLASSATVYRSGKTYEEALGALFRSIGPLVAVGRPGEVLPGGSGARRAYLPLNDWKDTVSELIDRARLVVLVAGPGPGTVWEFVENLRRSDPHRLVVLITDPLDYQLFKAAIHAEAEGVLHELKRKYGEYWQPPILPSLPPPKNPSARYYFHFRGAIHFEHDWEPRLTVLDMTGFNVEQQREIKKYFGLQFMPILEHFDRGASGSAANLSQGRIQRPALGRLIIAAGWLAKLAGLAIDAASLIYMEASISHDSSGSLGFFYEHLASSAIGVAAGTFIFIYGRSLAWRGKWHLAESTLLSEWK